MQSEKTCNTDKLHLTDYVWHLLLTVGFALLIVRSPAFTHKSLILCNMLAMSGFVIGLACLPYWRWMQRKKTMVRLFIGIIGPVILMAYMYISSTGQFLYMFIIFWALIIGSNYLLRSASR